MLLLLLVVSLLLQAYALGMPVNCIGTIEHGGEMLKLYRPPTDPHRPSLQQMKLVRHDTAYSPHEVLTALVVTEMHILVTSSQQNVCGPFHLSFWDATSFHLKHRLETQTPQTAMCWSHRAQTLFTAGHGIGAGTSSPIIAWDVRRYHKMRSLVRRQHSPGAAQRLTGKLCAHHDRLGTRVQ